MIIIKKITVGVLVSTLLLIGVPQAQAQAQTEVKVGEVNTHISRKKPMSDSYASMLVYVARDIDPEGTYVIITKTSDLEVTLEIREKLANHLLGIYTVNKVTKQVHVDFEM